MEHIFSYLHAALSSLCEAQQLSRRLIWRSPVKTLQGQPPACSFVLISFAVLCAPLLVTRWTATSCRVVQWAGKLRFIPLNISLLSNTAWPHCWPQLKVTDECGSSAFSTDRIFRFELQIQTMELILILSANCSTCSLNSFC